jgi:ribosomal protein S18 acetylase RimI-like enzyme
VGDATGWLRPFKGKGITTAILTGVVAADTIIHNGVSEEALSQYQKKCAALLQDHLYGWGVRTSCRLASRWGFMRHILNFAKEDPEAYDALFKSVSGHDSFRNILRGSLSLKTFIRFMRFYLEKNSFMAPLMRMRKKVPAPLKRRGFTMEEVLIRRLSMKDIEGVLSIDEKITGSTHEVYWEGVIANYIDRNPAACLAAEVDGKMVGFILGDVRGWEFNIPLSGWIEILGVDPQYQGKGIGGKLADSLFEYFRKNNIHSVHAMINWNDADLVDYFRSLGFARGNFIHMERTLD